MEEEQCRSRLWHDSLLVQGSREKEEEDQSVEAGRAARPALSQEAGMQILGEIVVLPLTPLGSPG